MKIASVLALLAATSAVEGIELGKGKADEDELSSEPIEYIEETANAEEKAEAFQPYQEKVVDINTDEDLNEESSLNELYGIENELQALQAMVKSEENTEMVAQKRKRRPCKGSKIRKMRCYMYRKQMKKLRKRKRWIRRRMRNVRRNYFRHLRALRRAKRGKGHKRKGHKGKKRRGHGKKKMRHQSPININRKHLTGKIHGDKAFSYKYGKLSFIDSTPAGSHGVKFSFKKAERGHFTTSVCRKWYPKIKKMTFIPLQFHFHSGMKHKRNSMKGSEHTYDGKHYPLELHIVHKQSNPKQKGQFLAGVVGVMFKLNKGHSFADTFLQALFSGKVVDTQKGFIDHINLMHRYVYKGSLTTPPYSESLLWNMVAMEVPINAKTLSLFRKETQMPKWKTERVFGEPNRRVQKTNHRRIFEVVAK